LENFVQTCAFDIVQIQIIYLLNLQYNVPLTRGQSETAEPLVMFCIAS